MKYEVFSDLLMKTNGGLKLEYDLTKHINRFSQYDKFVVVNSSYIENGDLMFVVSVDGCVGVGTKYEIETNVTKSIKIDTNLNAKPTLLALSLLSSIIEDGKFMASLIDIDSFINGKLIDDNITLETLETKLKELERERERNLLAIIDNLLLSGCNKRVLEYATNTGVILGGNYHENLVGIDSSCETPISTRPIKDIDLEIRMLKTIISITKNNKNYVN